MITGVPTAELPPDAIEVAAVVGAWGVKGWLKILPHSGDPLALFNTRRWYLLGQPGKNLPAVGSSSEVLQLEVQQIRQHAGVVLAQLEGVDARDAAAALRGWRVFLPRSGFPIPGADEYYWVDLIGLQVVNRQGVDMGVVVDLHPTGPHSVLVVQCPDREQVKARRMIPFVSAYVDSVSLTERRITVDWQPDY